MKRTNVRNRPNRTNSDMPKAYEMSEHLKGSDIRTVGGSEPRCTTALADGMPHSRVYDSRDGAV
jgi:hypothetical protein